MGNPGSMVKIELLKSGVLNATITDSTPIGSSGSGSYHWLIPAGQAAGTDYTMRISSISNGDYGDTSNSNFTIKVPNAIVVTSPGGGESWPAGTAKPKQDLFGKCRINGDPSSSSRGEA